MLYKELVFMQGILNPTGALPLHALKVYYFRIGNLNLADAASQAEQIASDASDPYSTDPARHKAIVINSKTPFNGETPLSILTDSFITPTGIIDSILKVL